MTLTHMALRWAHISMGLVGILSGAAALTFRKGSRPHEMVGHDTGVVGDLGQGLVAADSGDTE